MTMRAIYLAGPFRAPTAWGVEQNVRLAEWVGMQVAEMGVLPVIPHSMFRYAHGTRTEQFWIDATLELLSRCDAILMLKGWESSEGSIGEHKAAEARQMSIYYSTLELRADLLRTRGTVPQVETDELLCRRKAGAEHDWHEYADGSGYECKRCGTQMGGMAAR